MTSLRFYIHPLSHGYHGVYLEHIPSSQTLRDISSNKSGEKKGLSFRKLDPAPEQDFDFPRLRARGLDCI